MDREVALLAEMDKVKAEASEYNHASTLPAELSLSAVLQV